MRATNPREVGLIFREYARKIHAKALPTDPSFIRISVACGKVNITIFLHRLAYDFYFPSVQRDHIRVHPQAVYDAPSGFSH